MKAVLGIDVGTTAVKATILSDEGEVVGVAHHSHDLVSPHPAWAEEDVGDWWKGVIHTVQTVISTSRLAATDIQAVGVAGMVPAVVLLDSKGRPLRRSIQQNDARTARELDDLAKLVDPGEVLRRTRSRLNQQHVLPRMLWLRRHESETYAKIQRLCGSYDYVAYRLTGSASLEVNWAVESGLYDVGKGAFVPEWMEIAGIRPEWIPAVHAPTDVIGTVTKGAARATGLEPGTPVVAGSADHVASALAAGIIQTGDLLIKLGGAGDILYCTDREVEIPDLYFDLHDIPGLYLPNGCMASSGSLVKWFQRTFAKELAAGRDALADLDREAAGVPPGSGGIVVLPYFLGEKTPLFDPQARGVIAGLGLHHGRGHVFRAVLEAVMYGFRHHLDFLEAAGETPRRIVVSDGGARSALWRQIAAAVLGRPVLSHLAQGGASAGVAFVSGMATGVFRDWSEIEAFLDEGVTTSPDPVSHAVYDEAYGVYRDLYPRLVPLYSRLRSIEEATADVRHENS